MRPDLVPDTVEVVKQTSPASGGLPERLYSADMARSVTYNSSPIVLAAAIYIVLLRPAVRLTRRPEHRLSGQGVDSGAVNSMREIKVAAAQLGPIQKADTRQAVVGRMCRAYFQREPLFVNAANQRILRVDYQPPVDAGADRIVNAAGAYRKHGGPLVVLDFGTATTLDAVSRDGVFLGGAIAPGIHLAAEALASSATAATRSCGSASSLPKPFRYRFGRARCRPDRRIRGRSSRSSTQRVSAGEPASRMRSVPASRSQTSRGRSSANSSLG